MSSDNKNDQLFRVSNDAQVQTRRPVVIFIEGKEHLKIIDGFFTCPIIAQLQVNCSHWATLVMSLGRIWWRIKTSL